MRGKICNLPTTKYLVYKAKHYLNCFLNLFEYGQNNINYFIFLSLRTENRKLYNTKKTDFRTDFYTYFLDCIQYYTKLYNFFLKFGICISEICIKQVKNQINVQHRNIFSIVNILGLLLNVYKS